METLEGIRMNEEWGEAEAEMGLEGKTMEEEKVVADEILEGISTEEEHEEAEEIMEEISEEEVDETDLEGKSKETVA